MNVFFPKKIGLFQIDFKVLAKQLLLWLSLEVLGKLYGAKQLLSRFLGDL
jgi:hypothetical protein